MLTVSVVTPSLNQGEFLGQAIGSVASQAQEGLEHMVVDGGSVDRSLEVLARNDDRVRWLSEPDRGYAHAVNKAIVRTSGEIIGWLNADDLYCPHSLQRVRGFFQDNPQVDVVYGAGDYVDEDGDVIAPIAVKPWSLSRLRRSCFFCQPAVFFRRRVVEMHGLLDERLRYQPDYEFWLRLAAAGVNFAHLPERLGACRVHADNRYIWTENVQSRIEAAQETIGVMQRHFGHVPARWLLSYGRVLAAQEGYSADTSLRYDWSVLRHAIACTDRGQQRPTARIAKLVELVGRHVGRELDSMIRRPHLAARLLPPAASQFIRKHVRRKIFKLQHHEPRPLKITARDNLAVAPAEQPRVSIVTPSFNQGAYLEQTIRSVLNQQYPSLEYIVQDGGSSDNSVEIIRRHDRELKHWESATDGGQAHAINLGMQHASGEIMAYLNSDDLLLPGALHHVADFFRRNPEVDVVYGHRLLIDEQGDEIGRWVLPSHDDAVLPFADYIPQETMFWRRSAWDKVGGALNESFRFAMDWDLILRFREAGCRFQALPRFLGAFRVCDQQKTSSLIGTVGRLEMKRLRRRHLGHDPSRREIRRMLRLYMMRHWVLDKLYTLGVARY